MLRKLLGIIKLKKPVKSTSFTDWYFEFRYELCKKYGVEYAITTASWTFMPRFRYYYDKGFTPEEAVIETQPKPQKK